MADLIPPVPNDNRTTSIWKDWFLKVRTNLNQFAADISSILVDLTNVISTTNPLTVANISSYVNTNTISNNYVANATLTGAKIASATITDANIASLNADKIVAGSIRGINVNASSHTTKGSYLTSATSGGDATVNVKDTSDFPASGTAVVFDTTNDRDSFTFSGKTSTTLTGCSGVLAHNNSATVIPLLKCISVDGPTNEMRFYGDRGDGTVEELSSIGINQVGSDYIVGKFGSLNGGNSRWGIATYSNSGNGIYAQSSTNVAGAFVTSASGAAAVTAATSGAGPCISGDATGGTGPAIFLANNNTSGALLFGVANGRPSLKTNGSLAIVNTTGGSTDNRTGTPKLIIADGTNWRLVEDYTIWTG